MSEKRSVIKDKSFGIAIHIIILYKYLTQTKKEYVLSRQLLTSGTAIGAFVREAQNAESKKDFVHKLGISQKECDESMYWHERLRETEHLIEKEFDAIYTETTELLKYYTVPSLLLRKVSLNAQFIIHSYERNIIRHSTYPTR
ncbi:MAG TPA: four helix bundle protein [Prolixibacteraceae bacterium]|jgi:four helix bundle protein